MYVICFSFSLILIHSEKLYILNDIYHPPYGRPLPMTEFSPKTMASLEAEVGPVNEVEGEAAGVGHGRGVEAGRDAVVVMARPAELALSARVARLHCHAVTCRRRQPVSLIQITIFA